MFDDKVDDFKNKYMDWIGVILFVILVGFFFIVINFSSNWGLKFFYFIGCMILIILGLYIFINYEKCIEILLMFL